MKHTPSAIIGMGCFFPKSSGIRQFWRLVFGGGDAVTEVPPTHWSAEDYFDENPDAPDRVYCKRGGFLPRVSFDPTEFGIPPATLEATDTSQLLGLLAAKSALEHAGYPESRQFDRSMVSVILGATGTQELVIPLGARLGHPKWRKALKECGVPDDKAEEVVRKISESYVPWQENSFPGLLGNVIAGRICNRLDLGGTNCAVDAACASSMGAMHLALMELSSKKSEMVVTGGVDALNDIFMHMCFSKTHILSPTGDARPFSRDADGTVLGEGVGMIVLKRLEDAERDGDEIYAVVKGIGTSSDGRSKSIYSPGVDGQIKALSEAYDQAGVDPSTVELIEAHGTGTRVGDRVEFQSLSKIFENAPRNKCALGSVKSNIGHTKAAAGSAGIIKAVLSLYHKVLPPTPKVDAPDPELKIEESPFYLNSQARPWIANESHPRRAGVSAFGFGGSNFHVVLEEHDASKGSPSWSGAVEIFALSATSREPIQKRLEELKTFALPAPSMEEISLKAAESCASFESSAPFRLLFVFDPERDFATVLKGIEQDLFRNKSEDFWSNGSAFFGGPKREGKLAFLFPGQGSQYVNMGRDIVCAFPEALESLQRAEALFRSLSGGDSLVELVYPKLQGSSANMDALEDGLRKTNMAQPAIGVVAQCMATVLKGFGVVPEVACGHSFGELAALCSAGRISEDDLYKLAFWRGRLMSEASGSGGGMTAVKAPLNELEGLLKITGAKVVLANRNSPEQGVLSGPEDELAKAEAVYRGNGFVFRRLPVSAAFHSPSMRTVIEPFEKILSEIDFKESNVPVFSNATAGAYPENPADVARLLSEQIVSPVEFVREIENIYGQGGRIFLEVGPKSVLTGLVRTILRDKPVLTFAMDASSGKGDGCADLAKTLCFLAASGRRVELARWEKPSGIEIRKQRMSIPISGANIRFPNKVAARSKPDVPEKQTPSRQTVSFEKIETGGTDDGRVIDISNNNPKIQTMGSATARSCVVSVQPNPYPRKAMKAANINSEKSADRIQGALGVVRDGLRSIQSLQTQTAETHKKFLETQSEANRTLQQMMEHARRLAEVAMGVPVPVERVFEREAPVVFEQPYLERHPNPPAESRIETAIREESASKPSEHRPQISNDETTGNAVEPVEPVLSVSVGPRSMDLEKMLLSVVGELTGYPEEMLGLDMDIESDLGIDSIKRVEILSTLEEKVPGLPPVSPERMGKMKTLKQVLESLSSPETGQTESSGANSGRDAAVESMPESETAAILLAVASELTGYPAEMLGMEMDIESDLGIDSIKRVEILSALEERIPGLPHVSPESMGKMKTLGQIANILSDRQVSEAPAPVGTDSKDKKEIVRTAPSEGNGTGLKKTLLSVVSDLTGYPPEMLDLDMDIESDLGIDSIKRVEILSALEERTPGLPPVSPDKMGKLRTLGEIFDYLAGGDRTSAKKNSISFETNQCGSENPSVSHEEISKAPRPVPTHFVSLTEAPSPAGQASDSLSGGAIVVTGDGELSKSVVERLAEKSIESRFVPLESVVEGNGVSNASGLLIVSSGNADDEFLVGAFSAAKVFSKVRKPFEGGSPPLFATVSFLDGRFGFGGGRIENPKQGGLAGLVKTASVEWPDARCRALDLDPRIEDRSIVASLIAEEIAGGFADGHAEIGKGVDFRVALQLASAPVGEGKVDLCENDVVVVSGGAKGVTAQAVLALAEETSCKFVLLGRSPLPGSEPSWLAGVSEEREMKRAIIENEFGNQAPSPVAVEKAFRRYMAAREIARNIRGIEEKGSVVRYAQADVCDGDAVAKAFAEARAELGEVRAVIHGAGVLEDRLIEDKTVEQFRRVYDAKVKGLENLLRAAGGDRLKYLALFSSVAGRFGNKGQADYAMANEVLNKIARKEALSRPDCRVVSINWGPWDGGMVSPALRKEFERRNIPLIEIKSGGKCMVDLMRCGVEAPVEVVAGAPISEAEKNADSEKREPEGSNVAEDVGAEAPKLSLTFKRELDLERHPVLEAHRLNGKPVVPLALIAEWLGCGALHENPGLTLRGLDKLHVLNGIKLEGETKTIRLLAGKARKSNGAFEVDVEIRDGYQDGREIVHSRAKAILADDLAKAPAFDKSVYLEAGGYSKSVEELYDRILFHGVELQGLKKILSCTPEFMTAVVSPAPAPDKWMENPIRSRWIADPLVLDCAFQMAIVWTFEQKNMVCLPSFSESYRLYRRSFPSGDVTAVLEIRDVDDRKMRGDFTFLDENENVVARLIGYEAIMDPSLIKAFKPEVFKDALN